jgi:hypothetical protein
MGLGLTWAAQDTKSTTSRLEKSSRQLVGRLAWKVELDSPVGIPRVPRRLVADLKTRIPSPLLIPQTHILLDINPVCFSIAGNYAVHDATPADTSKNIFL